jgi:hypothetical protein
VIERASEFIKENIPSVVLGTAAFVSKAQVVLSCVFLLTAIAINLKKLFARRREKREEEQED